MKGRYCGMCDKWLKTTPTKDCPLCGAETDKAPADPNAVETTTPQRNAFHVHLDQCVRCQRHPFDLCSTGEALLRQEA